MDISKIIIILLGSVLIYLTFLFLGFNLKNKNIKAQNLTKWGAALGPPLDRLSSQRLHCV